MDKYTHSQIDSELLIATIKKNENIWNKDAKEYHKKSMREAAWNQVCEELVPGWKELTEENKNLKLLELKKRWNNIRDYYKKDLGLQLNGSIGQPSMKRKKYVFAKKLEFLRPYYGKISTNEKQSDEEETEEYYEVKFDSESDQSEEDSVPLAKKQKTTPSAVGTSSNFSTQEEREVEDESDLLFLKSLVPDMRALNRRQKIDFKLGILQLYKHIINQQPDSVDPFLDENDDRKFSLQ
ncbi:uncharacterized protein [Choristoneura fumiferana]|uniref:uncharacterized protein n=1 Tax=Choristoneura fumiferana TaxID=7141 RepID=UPI003D15BF18